MKLAIKIVVTFGIFALLFHYIDFQGVWNAMLNSNPLYLLLALLFQFLSTAIASFRWFFIMRILKYKEDFYFYFRSYFKGSFFNQLLPSNIGGDAIRILHLKEKGYSVKESFYGIFIDRVLGILSLLFLNILVNLTNPEILPHSLYQTINYIAAIGIFGVLFLILFHRSQTLKNFPIIKFFSEMSLRFYTVFRETVNFLKQFGMSILVHICSILSIFMLAQAVGMKSEFVSFFLIIPLVILFMALPISLAGWGIREGAMVGLFVLVGAQKELVLSVSLLYGIVVIVSIIPGFVYWLIDKRSVV